MFFVGIDESSQNSRLQSDMSTSKTELPKYSELKASVEDIFDSGILSGSNLSSGVISETDSKYSDNLSDYEDNSGSLMKQSLEGASKAVSSNSSDRCKLDLSMKLDSGIEDDWSSDHYSCSKYDNQSAESSPVVLPDKDVSYFPSFHPVFVPHEYDESFWESYFEPADEDGNT